MPYVPKKQYTKMNNALASVLILRSELKKYERLIYEYKNKQYYTFNLTKVKEMTCKRDLLKSILGLEMVDG